MKNILVKWQKLKFKDFADTSPTTTLKKGEEYPFIPMEVVDGITKTPYKVLLKKYNGGGAKFTNGDTIFARITPCLENGKIAFIKNLEDGIGFGSTEYFVFRAKENVSAPNYLYYLSRTEIIRGPAEKSMIGASGRQRADKTTIENIEILAPPVKNQQKIASILSAYDDLIEVNNRRIKILEEMSQLIYKEWFVKFKFPGHEKVKKKNGVPEGWELSFLNKFVDFERGIEPGSKNYLDKKAKGSIPFLRVGDLGSRNSEIFIEESLAKSKTINKNDIAVSMDGTVGIVKMGLEGAYSTGIRRLIIKGKAINRTFLYYLMLTDNIQNTIKAHAQGATILHASRSIDYMKFLLPPNNILDKFSSLVEPMLDLKLKLEEININLIETRDLLLPKLMSGGIEVK